MNGYSLRACIHADVDQCAANTDGCAQTCTNTAGSYQCSCDAGYTLNSDGHTCDGKTMLFILLIHI